MDAIRNNQTEFLQLLNAAPSDLGSIEREQASANRPTDLGSSGSNIVSISVSENDRGAIQRVIVQHKFLNLVKLFLVNGIRFCRTIGN